MLDLIFDRTAEDVANRTDKGLYRHTDLNRVQDAVLYLRGVYTAAGYDAVSAVTFRVWHENDVPRRDDGDKYIRGIRSLDGLIPIPGKPALPVSPDGLDYSGANAIEKFLFMTEDSLVRIASAWFYCDEVFAGEVDV